MYHNTCLNKYYGTLADVAFMPQRSISLIKWLLLPFIKSYPYIMCIPNEEIHVVRVWNEGSSFLKCEHVSKESLFY